MTWSWVYLAVSVVGALLVVNAFRPLRHPLFAVPSFFAGWYTAEMPVWHIVWQVAATTLFALEGAFGHWPGWLGLAVSVAAWAGLLAHTRVSLRARHVFALAEREGAEQEATEKEAAEREAAERQAEEALGAVGVLEGLPLHGGETMWRFPRLVYPLPRPAFSMRVDRNIDYSGDGLRAHRLDVIRRRGPSPQGAPVLVYIHGGAWVIGDKREQGLPMLHELARRGWVTVTINYRLSPRATWPDHVVDCKRALAWVRDHIAEYGGDPGFVALSGGSAGGHLAALCALSPGDGAFQPGFEAADTSVDACVPFYGVYDMTVGGGKGTYDAGLLDLLERRVFKCRLADDPGRFEAASPLHRVNADAPPFFVIHGTTDTLVPVAGARNFVKALRSVSRAPVLYAELPYTQHAFDVLPSVRTGHAVAAVVRFLEGVRRRRAVATPPAPDSLGALHSPGN